MLFALFCGSLAIMFSSKLSGESLGPYQYLLAMGACATCNGYWLFARSMFRTNQAIQPQHLILAGIMALLIVLNKGMLFTDSLELTSTGSGYVKYALSELTMLLSSCILVLSFWEGVRGFNSDNNAGKAQRILFLSTFGLAVMISKVCKALFVEQPQVLEFATLCIILMVVVNSQILLLWRKQSLCQSKGKESSNAKNSNLSVKNAPKEQIDVNLEYYQLLAKQVEKLIYDDALYLQPNLKVSDIAQLLSLPEYRISKALRYHLQAKNFNRYVNELRIQHALNLLADPNNQKWTILVIGLESGFASVGPFTRTFKSITGLTPNQYRKQILSNNINLVEKIPASA